MRNLIPGVLLITSLNTSLVLAHHGPVGHPGRYLAENLVELEGEITAVFWRNPHPRFRLQVLNEDGEETTWELETNGSPMSFGRRGISADDLARVGDHVKVAGVVSRRDASSLGVLHILKPNGEEYINGDRELRWSDVRMVLAEEQAIDAAKVRTAEQAARSIFRVWDDNVDGTFAHPPLSAYRPFLTERGRELAAAYDYGRDDPELNCQQGMPTTMFDPVPMQLIDDGDRILIHVQEYDIERIIHLDADQGATEPQGSPLGYSVGRWDGDTLVVNTTHIDWPYFDPDGTPQSGETRYTETFALADDGNALNYSFTATDPVIFTEPITLERRRGWAPGVEIVPYDCAAQWEGSED